MAQAKEGQVHKVEVPLDGELFDFYIDSYGSMVMNLIRLTTLKSLYAETSLNQAKLKMTSKSYPTNAPLLIKMEKEKH